MTAISTRLISTSVPASPSTPSIMLTALISPTIAKTVTGTAAQPSDRWVESSQVPQILQGHAGKQCQHRRRQDLSKNSPAPIEIETIIQRTHNDHQAAASEQTENLGRDRPGENQSSRHGNDHGNATHHRHRRHMVLASAGMIHQVQAVGRTDQQDQHHNRYQCCHRQRCNLGQHSLQLVRIDCDGRKVCPSSQEASRRNPAADVRRSSVAGRLMPTPGGFHDGVQCLIARHPSQQRASAPAVGNQ